MFDNIKVGDTLKRVRNGFNGEKEKWDAKVIELTENEIVCEVVVDILRTMKFSRRTGVNIYGSAYGWLEQ